MKNEVKDHLINGIIPFWKRLRDDRYGGYYGGMDDALRVNVKADKGCIQNSRILWFFSNAYTLLKEDDLLEEARHGFDFLRNNGMDRKNGGIFWSMSYDGSPADTTKHTYNQAFAVYALSSYYEASGDKEALLLALELFHLIEAKCTDEIGYKEAFDESFREIGNDKLSENGVIASKTMNTLLHVFEAYTELYRVYPMPAVKERLKWILDTFAEKVYNKALHRLEVFFDTQMNSILDLHSYGHDIEAAWLIDRGAAVLGVQEYFDKMMPITCDLTAQIYKTAFDGHSLDNECDRGVVDTNRIWWVQAEAVVGFLNGYVREPEKKEYLEAALRTWDYIKKFVIDRREGSEWFREVDADGKPLPGSPLVEPWKCPYHNGRMCFEVVKTSVLR